MHLANKIHSTRERSCGGRHRWNHYCNWGLLLLRCWSAEEKTAERNGGNQRKTGAPGAPGAASSGGECAGCADDSDAGDARRVHGPGGDTAAGHDGGPNTYGGNANAGDANGGDANAGRSAYATGCLRQRAHGAGPAVHERAAKL